LQCRELTEGLRVDRLGLPPVGVLLDRHQRLELPHEVPDLGLALALHRCGHHRRGRLRDGTALPGDLDVLHDAVLDVDEDDDLVPAQWVEAVRAMRRRRQLAAVARGAVVIEDDLSIEIL